MCYKKSVFLDLILSGGYKINADFAFQKTLNFRTFLMIYFKKLFYLIKKILNKFGYLIRECFHFIEVKILIVGLSLTLLTGLYLSYLLFADPALYKTLFSTAVVHLMGGRALGIAACLSAGISIFYTVAYNFLLEVIIVLIAYGVVVLIMRNIIEPKLFKDTVRQAELAAQNQKTKIKRYGPIGLFFFVMLPFFMTGPVIGSLIGYLLNYKPTNNFLIVFSGTLCSIVIYALLGNNILNYIDRYIPLEIIKTWGSIIIGLLILMFLIYHLKTIKAFLDTQSLDD